MSNGLPVVAIFGATGIVLHSDALTRGAETTELDCRCFENDEDLGVKLAAAKPGVIVSIGALAQFPHLADLPFDLRRRWLHYPAESSLEVIGRQAYRALIRDVAIPRESPPLVTVFTPTYRSGTKILRPLQSLMAQTHANWEWILFDDSDDGGETFALISEIATRDPRVGAFKAHRHSGVIGEVKRQAARLGRGSILVELDHDDELTATALSDVVSAFKAYPHAGFAYTDCAEVFEDGRNATYGDYWGFGYGKTTPVNYLGRELLAHRAPLINPKSIRHIVSAPNHIRAWKRDFYDDIGGHSHLLHIADDYEMCIRTFLRAPMIQIRSLGYIQYYNSSGNTQHVRNKDIQRTVRILQEEYDLAIHQRFTSLGIWDYMWDAALGRTNWQATNPLVEDHATLIWEKPVLA